MQGRRVAGIVLVILGIVFVLLTVTTVYALPLGLIVLVLGILLIVRIRSGGALFPAIREQLDYRDSMREVESRPGPTCWRCKRQNRPFATVCEACGAELTQ